MSSLSELPFNGHPVICDALGYKIIPSENHFPILVVIGKDKRTQFYVLSPDNIKYLSKEEIANYDKKEVVELLEFKTTPFSDFKGQFILPSKIQLNVNRYNFRSRLRLLIHGKEIRLSVTHDGLEPETQFDWTFGEREEIAEFIEKYRITIDEEMEMDIRSKEDLENNIFYSTIDHDGIVLKLGFGDNGETLRCFVFYTYQKGQITCRDPRDVVIDIPYNFNKNMDAILIDGIVNNHSLFFKGKQNIITRFINANISSVLERGFVQFQNK